MHLDIVKAKSTIPIRQHLGSCCHCHPMMSDFHKLFGSEKLNIETEPRLQIAPLELSLHFPGGDVASGFDFIKQLQLEVELLKLKVSKRPIKALTIRDPSGTVSDADLTRLMYIFGKNLCLFNSYNRSYNYECPPRRLTKNRIALLAGLGFNHVTLNLSPSASNSAHFLSGELKDRLKLYGFIKPSVVLYYGKSTNIANWRHLITELLHYKPEKIVAQRVCDNSPWPGSADKAPSDCEGDQFLLIYSRLKRAGYRVIGNDCFVAADHELVNAQNNKSLCRTASGYNALNINDCLSLGPGAHGKLGALYYCNWGDFDHYRNALNYMAREYLCMC